MFRIILLAIFVFALTVEISAQTRGGTNPRSPSNVPSTPSGPPSAPTRTPGPFFISGKVIIDDGTLLTDHPAIKSLCNGRTRIETYTDSKGHFSFEIKGPNQANIVTEDASDSSQADFGRASSQLGRGRSDFVGSYLRSCQLAAALPGFTSGTIELAAKVSDIGSSDVGTLVLHRLAQVEGVTLSVTSAQAPSKAKKEYDKGRESEKKEKWDAAQESFQKAIDEYPQYAIAWYELGRVQVKKGDSDGARKSFHQSLSADAKFVSPYHELAQLAFREQKWQDVVDSSAELLKLNPISFPEDWWLNAAGNYNLKNFDAAEKSGLRGLEIDKQHQFPSLEYIVGLTLAQKRDYKGAAEHLRNYLNLEPHAANAEAIQKQADEIERLAQQTTADK